MVSQLQNPLCFRLPDKLLGILLACGRHYICIIFSFDYFLAPDSPTVMSLYMCGMFATGTARFMNSLFFVFLNLIGRFCAHEHSRYSLPGEILLLFSAHKTNRKPESREGKQKQWS